MAKETTIGLVKELIKKIEEQDKQIEDLKLMISCIKGYDNIMYMNKKREDMKNDMKASIDSRTGIPYNAKPKTYNQIAKEKEKKSKNVSIPTGVHTAEEEYFYQMAMRR